MKTYEAQIEEMTGVSIGAAHLGNRFYHRKAVSKLAKKVQEIAGIYNDDLLMFQVANDEYERQKKTIQTQADKIASLEKQVEEFKRASTSQHYAEVSVGEYWAVFLHKDDAPDLFIDQKWAIQCVTDLQRMGDNAYLDRVKVTRIGYEEAHNVGDAEALARKFHKYYEGLAHVFGYQTRKDSRNFDPDSKNGKLMIAVCEKILIDLAHKETS